VWELFTTVEFSYCFDITLSYRIWGFLFIPMFR
jgi:hypothetical protein